MSFSVPAKAHYACLAVLELASRYDGGDPVAIREITDRQGIPQPFLVQILQQLKLSGIVTSTRGSQGGYRLAIDPEEISLLEICDAVGCGDADVSPVSEQTTHEACVLDNTWKSASAAFRTVLAGKRLADIVKQSAKAESSMFYI